MAYSKGRAGCDPFEPESGEWLFDKQMFQAILHDKKPYNDGCHSSQGAKGRTVANSIQKEEFQVITNNSILLLKRLKENDK